MKHTDNKESIGAFLKNVFRGLFVESWILLWDSAVWRVETIKRIFVGTDCSLSPRNCIGAFSSRKDGKTK